jgi:hypothetical protein
MALLPEGQQGEASELSKKQRSFEIHGALDRKVLSPCFRLWGLMLPRLYIKFGVAKCLVRKSLHCRIYIVILWLRSALLPGFYAG